VIQRGTTHYAAYDRYWTTVTPLIVEWFDDHLRSGGVVVRSDGDASPDRPDPLEDS
jgi:hypothetical protein